MLIISILLIIISIILISYSFYLKKNIHQINKDIDIKNNNLKNEFDKLNSEIEISKQRLDDIQSNITNSLENQKELSRKAFENYYQLIEKQYEECEKEFKGYNETLEEAYANRQSELMKEVDQTKKELDKLRATRAAAIQAQLKEKEIKENRDNFRLNISKASLNDIKLLKSIQKDITNSIVIDKIIWSNYYQPLAKIKFPKIIGKETTCGIYKITSLITELAYIGQSTDCCDRWKQHCKNALGVGNINSTNKLYSAMKEDGLNNFTFEIIEECSKEQLDEKEKYYIELYNTYNFGLNGNKGNN